MLTLVPSADSVARVFLLRTAGLLLLTSMAAAQAWSPPFNHNDLTAPYNGNGSHTNPYSPWGPVAANTVTPPPAVALYANGWPLTFNAVHMALIPKGPYQGMVLVWDIAPVRANDPPNSGLPIDPASVRSFQPYAIIDPKPTPTTFRFRNYLLPMQGGYTPDGFGPNPDGEGLFCAGHTWSPFGDLIVVGGTVFYPGFAGANFTYAFNPDAPWGTYPNSAWTPYADFGYWQGPPVGPTLSSARWYPTATLTYPLPRLAISTPPLPPREREVVLVSGGSGIDPNLLPMGTVQASWNTFESLIVDARATSGTVALIKDAVGPPTTQYTATGPGTPAGPVDVDWFEEYPRLHMLSTGSVFMSGYATRWAYMDPNVLPIAWTRDTGSTYSSNWQNARHDAPSILFPNIAVDDVDRVMRMGGADTHWYFTPPNLAGTTQTVESISAGVGGAAWTAEASLPITIGPVPPISNPNDPTLGGRYLANAVIVPTADILVFGGEHRSTSGAATRLYDALIFRNGVWRNLGRNPFAGGSVRDYHSTAVLLPDGSVFLGGGNNRNRDYEIFFPDYRTDPMLLAHKPANVVFQTPPNFDPDFDAFRLSYDTEFTVLCNALPTGVALERAVLMAPGSVTHHSDMCQRYVGMETTGQNSNKLTFKTPIDPKRAPRGIYMLFLVTTSRAVSDAVWVFLP